MIFEICSLKHSAHIRTRLKRRVFGILLLVVLAVRQPAFVLRIKFCAKTRAFKVTEFYRNRILCYARQKRRKSCRISEYFNKSRAQNSTAKIEFVYVRYA